MLIYFDMGMHNADSPTGTSEGRSDRRQVQSPIPTKYQLEPVEDLCTKGCHSCTETFVLKLMTSQKVDDSEIIQQLG
jgi:hypothetical protein